MTSIRDFLAPIFGLLQVGEAVAGAFTLRAAAAQDGIAVRLTSLYWVAVLVWPGPAANTLFRSN